jgi:hypothetical protein
MDDHQSTKNPGAKNNNFIQHINIFSFPQRNKSFTLITPSLIWGRLGKPCQVRLFAGTSVRDAMLGLPTRF